MGIEKSLRDRIDQLVVEARSISTFTVGATENIDSKLARADAWTAEAIHLIELACPSANHSYRRSAERITTNPAYRGGKALMVVRALGEVLRRIADNIDNGLLVSLANRVRAETFDTFLEHADHYLEDNAKDVAGVIAGVAFEDTIRRMARDNGIADAGMKLDTLISDLAKQDVLSSLQAKNARADAGLRTSATHAQWGEFQEADVRRAIDHTRELIRAHLDS